MVTTPIGGTEALADRNGQADLVRLGICEIGAKPRTNITSRSGVIAYMAVHR